MANSTAFSKKEEVLIGVLIESDTDDFILLETDTTEYMIEVVGLGKKLANYLDETVEIVGAVSEDENGNLLLSASAFEIIDEDEDEDDYEYRYNYDDEE